MTPLAPHITAYFQEYLPNQKGVRPNTCETYAYSFQSFFTYAETQLKVSPSNFFIEQLNVKLVTHFLNHLEYEMKRAISTRNVRLAAIKSFFRFLERRLPAILEQVRQILDIPTKKADSKLVHHLNQEEQDAILSKPDLETRMGIRDYAMIQLYLATGVRVSELLGLTLQDLTLQPSASIRVLGKGRKERELPLCKGSARVLQKWLVVRGDLPVLELFVNARDEPLTRWGVGYILKKYVKLASEQCPSLKQKKVSPHVLRHTCAMRVLDATHDIRKVALWLGHNSTQTTEIYVRADPSRKLEAINAITPLKVRNGRFRATDKVLAMLKAQTLCGANWADLAAIKPIRRYHSP